MHALGHSELGQTPQIRTSPSTPRDTGPSPLARPGSELVDDGLLEEIALLADVIASLGGVVDHLSPEQVDAVLGLPRRRA